LRFIDFVELHRRLSIGIAAHRYSLASDVAAVQLLTAHKSKGLEFDTVYVFNSVDSVWGQGARSVSRSISYPENLPLAPAGNSADERLRLFYVAMTRAKNELIMTYSDANDVLRS
jgi:DNA helicase-2/ATP-dependent DNA helicase PcrA